MLQSELTLIIKNGVAGDELGMAKCNRSSTVVQNVLFRLEGRLKP